MTIIMMYCVKDAGAATATALDGDGGGDGAGPRSGAHGGDGGVGDIKPRKQLSSRPRHSTNPLSSDVNTVCSCLCCFTDINTAFSNLLTDIDIIL